MRWLEKAGGAPTTGKTFEGVLFNVTFRNKELKVDPIDPNAAQAALGPCDVISMNGVSDPKSRTDRSFIAFKLDCGPDHLAVVTMTVQNASVIAAYIHNNNYVPVVMN